MKILFVANRVPYPPFRGDKLKIWNLAGHLSKDHELHLFTIAQNREELQHAEILKTRFKEVHILYMPVWKSWIKTAFALLNKLPFQVAYFQSKAVLHRLENYLSMQDYDAVHVQHIRMGYYFRGLPKNKVVLDLPDAFSLYWKRRAERAGWPWLKWFASLEHKRLYKFESRFLNEFPLSLVCSDEDRQYLLNHCKANIQVLPNGVDTAVFSPKSHVVSNPKRLLFTGNMDYEPNVDAVEYFCKEIFPSVQTKFPDVEFVIAGQRPVGRVLALANDYIKVTGFVNDIAEEYAKAGIVVAPLRFGAGTQNKVLEALSMGVPVICTQVGFKGLGLQNGEGIVMAGNTESFINEINRLLGNEDERNRLAGKGMEKIRSTFGWDAVAIKLNQYLEGLTK